MQRRPAVAEEQGPDHVQYCDCGSSLQGIGERGTFIKLNRFYVSHIRMRQGTLFNFL